MLRTKYFVIIPLLLLAWVMGCSGANNGPISPITPDEPALTPDRLPQGTATPPATSDEYWNATITMGGNLWIANVNPNGTIHRAMGPGVKESSDPFEVIKNHPELFVFGPENFTVQSDSVHAEIRYVMLRQMYKDLWVYPSRVDLRYGRGGNLVLVGADVYPDVNVQTTPSFPESSAISIMQNEIGSDQAFERSELVVYANENKYTLAWIIECGTWKFYIDAHSGDVLKRVHHYWTAYTGHITVAASQPDPLAPEINYNATDLELRLRVSSSDTTSYPPYAAPISNSLGFYSYDDHGAHSILYHDVRFYGPYMNVNNTDGYPNTEGKIIRTVNDGVDQEFTFSNSNSIRSERTGWVWTNAYINFLKSIEPSYDKLNRQGAYARFSCNVNGDPWCNAYADGDSINFFKSESGCLDTGIVPDVIVHEMAHNATFKQYGSLDVSSEMHEGMSDIAANLMIEDHLIGKNIQGAGTYFRDSKNTMKWPAPECGGEGHCLGQMLAGAFWDMYEVLGKDYTGYLYHFSRWGLPMTFQEMAAEVVIVDDDDDNPLNGTPNYDLIFQCFKTNHNISVPGAPNQPTSGISVDVYPLDPQVHIGRAGGNFWYKLKITNHDATPTSFQVWAVMQAPAGWFYGPVIPPAATKHAPYQFTWQPGQVFTINLRQAIPANVPPGIYKYHIRVGQWVDNTHDVLADDGWFDVYIDP